MWSGGIVTEFGLKILICLVVTFQFGPPHIFQGASAQHLDSSQQCGKTLVPYGTTDHRVSAPWTAILFLKNRHTQGVYLDWIAGVIVGPSTVITRGRQFWEAGLHNTKETRPRLKGFKPQNVLVGVGIFNHKSFELDNFAQIIEVEYIRPHPKSYIEHSEYDFAIVQLRKPISLSTKVHPICVEPTSSATFTKTYDFTSDFLKAPKRLSGHRHWANYTVFASRYRLQPPDVCDSQCQTLAPSSTEEQFDNGGPPCPPRPRRPAQQDEFEDFFLVGASLASWQNNRWYLAGIVTKTYGCKSRFKHFISLIATKVNLNWINSNIRNAGSKYTCLDGSAIETISLCNGRVDCTSDGGSDEDAAYCEALNCPAHSFQADLCNVAIDSTLRVRNGPTSAITIRSEPQRPVISSQSEPQPATTTPQIFGPVPTTREPLPPSSHSTNRPAFIAFPETVPTRRPATPSPKDPEQGPRCPPLQLTSKEKEGIRFQCTNSRQTTAYTDCSDSDAGQLAGTKMLLTCRPHYKSGSSFSFSEMNCGSDGNWVRRGGSLTCVIECGVAKAPITGHIVNGTATVTSNWPWNAALFKKVNNEFTYFCGATLITSTSLVTAAHCVYDMQTRTTDLRIVLAPISSKFTANKNFPHSQILGISQVHVNDLYNPATYEADIAIIKTTVRVEITDHVYPACFPFPGRENEQIERFQTSPGNIGIVAGFGVDESLEISDTLKSVRLPVVSVRDCSKALDIFPTASQLCAGYTTGISVCNGDSGAGLLFQEEDARKLYFLQAIVSYGQSGDDGRLCDYNRYSIFTRVGAFKEWVERIVVIDSKK